MAGAAVALLSRSEVLQLTGSALYCGGLFDRRGGTVQPLAYVRGRDYALPQDVLDMALDVMRHRLVPSFTATSEGVTPDRIVAELIEHTPAREGALPRERLQGGPDRQLGLRDLLARRVPLVGSRPAGALLPTTLACAAVGVQLKTPPLVMLAPVGAPVARLKVRV